MFSDDQNLRKIQESCLNILKYFDELCNKNGLTYYLCGGTLLGAIRHKGFIPWDDDADVVMPRDDYEKLIQIANNQLDIKYELQHFSLVNNKTDIRTHHIQIVDKTIPLIRKWTKEETIIYPWIDILPLDGMPNNSIKRNLHYIHYRFWHYCMQLSMFDQNININKERNILEKLIILFINKVKIGHNWDTIAIMNKMKTIASKYPFDYGDWICSFCGVYKRKEILKRSIFETRILVDFEDSKFYCMKDYDKDLKNYYGDYMILDAKQTRKHDTETNC